MRAPRFLGTNADLDHDPGFGHAPMAGARHLRIGIDQCRDDARHTRGNGGVGAGRGLAVVGARLERHIESGPARSGAGAPQRLHLGMGAAAGLGPATPDDDAVLHHHGADGRIGPGAPEPTPAERKRERHETLVVGISGRLSLVQRRPSQLVSVQA
jgi:hypothetical protein